MSKRNLQNARNMRRIPTDAERRLWSILRHRQLQNYKFRRQHPIGPYIVDFANIENNLVIEADGGQHASNERDERRTKDLKQWGWQILRFWNNDILANAEGVTEAILKALDTNARDSAARFPRPREGERVRVRGRVSHANPNSPLTPNPSPSYGGRGALQQEF
ncbi:MAG: endonuclease domain-containing protein [Bdellovibrionales bacterium]